MKHFTAAQLKCILYEINNIYTIYNLAAMFWNHLFQISDSPDRKNPVYLSACVSLSLVSASNVTPTDRWLNVWCIWYSYLETLQECRSRRRTGWIIQDFRETCVLHFLTFPLETKMLWCQTSSWKKKAFMFTNVMANAYQGQLNVGFSKVCELF